MATCPDGHESASTDFCNVCGMRIAGPPPGTPVPPRESTVTSGLSGQTCPNCGAARTGQFCETCGLNFDAPAPPASPGFPAAAAPASAAPASVAPAPVAPAPVAPARAWTAVVTADREHFDRVIAAGGPEASTIQFPAYCPDRLFRLTGTQMRIGRRSASRGIEPEIDLTGPPPDTGVSHLHAVLIAEPDGSWSVLDPGSSNGTQLNGAEIVTGERMPLHDGDRICLGGWTVLTIRAS